MAFGSKNSTPSFVLTLPLDISLNEQDYLYKEFKKCGTIYNQLVSVTTKMWHQLRKILNLWNTIQKLLTQLFLHS